MASVDKRTRVYLSDGLAAAVEASGVPLAELIRRGLAYQPGGTGLIKPETAREAAEPGAAVAADRGPRRRLALAALIPGRA